MAEYKVYQLDGARRIAEAAHRLEADSDDSAIAAATMLKKAGPCEIWQGRRLVATIPATARRR